MAARLGRCVALLAWCLVLLVPTLAQAHGANTSYVVLTPNGRTIDGSLTLDLADTATGLGLSRADLLESPGREAVVEFLVGHLSLTDGKDGCPIESAPRSLTIDLTSGMLSLPFVARCASVPAQLGVDFRLFFRAPGLGIVRLEGDAPETRVFTSGRPTGTMTIAQGVVRPSASPWSFRGLSSAIRTGVLHIWSGADHLLFLVALLMTSVVERVGSRWMPRASLRDSLVDVAKIVTGFTLTHSVTLSLAALGFLRPAARIIEPAIAASVAIAALDNLWPFLRGRKWMVASSLGLLHGFGFASALDELNVPRESLLTTLVGFGLGVEIGQFLFVLAFVPVAFALRGTSFYRRWVLSGGSGIIVMVALVWMVLRLIPTHG